ICQGVLAAYGETAKQDHYEGAYDPASTTLVPAAVEAYGCYGAVVKNLPTSRWQWLLNGPSPCKVQVSLLSGPGRSLACLRQSISVALQMASRRELAMFTAVRGLENPLPEHAPPA
ncbi:unnamed protein product, partial [Chrysoparadoxa australica]